MNNRTSSLSRPQDIREVKQSFLIVYEGICTESDYFRAFRMTTSTINVGQVMNTISMVKSNQHTWHWHEEKTYIRPVLVVFDKGNFPTNDFYRAIALARHNGFRVTYNNQAFEYWFLLHFNLYRGPKHRNSYADEIYKTFRPYLFKKQKVLGCKIYNRLLHLQQKAIKDATAVMKKFSQGNLTMENRPQLCIS